MQDHGSSSSHHLVHPHGIYWNYHDLTNLHKTYLAASYSNLAPDFWVSLAKYLPFFVAQTDRLSFNTVSSRFIFETFYTYAQIWLNAYKSQQIHSAIFFSTPHLGFDFVGYAVAEILGLKIRIVNRTGLLLSSRITRSIDLWNQNLENLLVPGSWNYQHYNESLCATSSSLSRSQNLNKQTRRSHLSPLTLDILSPFIYAPLFRSLKSLIRQSIGRPPVPRESSRWLNDPPHSLKQVYERFMLIKRTRSLLTHYKSLCGIPPERSPYILFAAHFQPERTTAPEGGCFEDQMLCIDTLLGCIPQDVLVFYKEHPRQFDINDLRRKHYRTTEFYNRLKSRPNVILLDPFSDSSHLIDKCLAVATVTGTSGWQALQSGKPCIVFGDAWYRNCKACLHVSDLNSSSLRDLLQLDFRTVQSAKNQFLDFASRTFVHAPSNQLRLESLETCNESEKYAVILSRALYESLLYDH